MATRPEENRQPDTVVLIHGLWLTPRSWENWIDRYQARGMRVLAPAWPGMDRDVEALREDPTAIGELTVDRIVDHYDRIIRDLDRPPIIMGHSFGGAFAQILIDRGLGAAGVAICSAATKGVMRTPLATLRSEFPVLHKPGSWHRAVPLAPEEFHNSLANTMTQPESDRAYYRYHVPAAGHVLFEGALANLNPRAAIRVDFGRNDRAPLLLIAGELDHVSPPMLVKMNAGHYRKSRAVTGYHEFPGRSHFIIGQVGWEEVADYALDWALEAARTNVPLTPAGAPRR